MTPCPKTTLLQQLLDEALPVDQKDALQVHLGSCSVCQAEIERLVASGPTWDRTARNLASAPTGDETALVIAMDKLRESPTQAAPMDVSAVTMATVNPTGGIADEDLGFLQPSTKPGSIGRLDKYEILSVVGKGGFGVVLKAFDESLHRLVAIKIMAPQIAANGAARQRFIREARAAAAVTHEHVVAIYEVNEKAQIPYLAMQFIGGMTLHDKLEKIGPLSVKEILRIGSQIAEGLAAAHGQGLIHRDIKPGNILLENGVERVKITDFGLARSKDDASVSQSGTVAGTPMYMSPEQANGDAIDHRSDLFSLGSVLYVMCTGKPPFRANSTLAVMKRVAEDTPTPIRTNNNEIPEWLCGIIEKLHAKKPGDRFQSAAEVAEVLRQRLADVQAGRYVHSEPRPANLEAATEQATLSPTRSRMSWVLAIGLVVLGILTSFAGALILSTGWVGLTDLGRLVAPLMLVGGLPIVALGTTIVLERRSMRITAGAFTCLLALATLAAPVVAPRYFSSVPRADYGTLFVDNPDHIQYMIEPGDLQHPVKLDPNDMNHFFLEPGFSYHLTAFKDNVLIHQQHIKVHAKERLRVRLQDGWTHLFNGKDLNGWKTDPKFPGKWEVAGGELIGRGQDLGYLYTQRGDYENFHIRVEAQINAAGYGGVCFRCPFGSQNGSLGGFRAVIGSRLSDFAKAQYTGTLLQSADQTSPKYGPKTSPVLPDTWFTQEIIARGTHIVIKVNGEVVADCPDADPMWKRGYLTLLVMPNTVVRFRKIEINELPPDPPAPINNTEWVQLFNGKDLTGWNLPPPTHKFWRIEKGELVASGPGPLSSRKHYRNFHFRIEAMMDQPGVGSQRFRVDGWGPAGPPGYNALFSSLGGVRQTGTLLVIPPESATASVLTLSNEKPLAPGQWFTQEVIADGPHITVKVNGKVVTDWIDTTHVSGSVAVDGDAKAVIRFRKIEIKELPASKPTRPVPVGEWTPIFNGKDLAGWHTHPQQPDGWKVEGGTLAGRGPANRNLYSDRADFGNFHLRAEAQINYPGESAICFRCAGEPTGDSPLGSVMRINQSSTVHPTGSLQINGKTVLKSNVPIPSPHDKWMNLEIIAQGPNITLMVNGKVTAKYEQASGRAKGHIVFQVSSRDTLVRFRKIEIKELPPNSPNPPTIDSEWTQLFNGKDLKGWRLGKERSGVWTVADGRLVGRGNQAWLLTERSDFRDFHLRLHARYVKGTASFVLRGQGERSSAGYWLYMNNEKGNMHTGALMTSVNFKAHTTIVREQRTKPNEWFTLEIIARGKHFRTFVNGEQALDWTDPETTNVTHGELRFSLQGKDAEFEVKAVEIKELPETAPPVRPRPPGNYALEFDGQTNHIEIPSLRYETDQPVTIEMRVKFAKAPGPIEDLVTGVSPKSALILARMNGNMVFLARRELDANYAGLNAPVPDGEWTHIAGVWDGKKPQLFINGKRLPGGIVKAVPPEAAALQDSHFRLGVDKVAPIAPLNSFFHGHMDEVRISKVARYTDDFTPANLFTADKDTVALYHCDEGEGEKLIDASGNNHHGKVVGVKWVKADWLPPEPTSVDILTSPEYEWSTPVNLGTGINSGKRNLSATLTGDECTIVFARDGKIWTSRRKNREEPFPNAVPLPDYINVDVREEVSMSADGLLLALCSSRDGSEKDDIWLATRKSVDDPFGTPVRLPSPINSNSYERAPVLSADGLTLLLTSMRHGGKRSGEILTFTRKSRDEPFGNETLLPEPVNTESFDTPNWISPDGRMIITTIMSMPPFETRYHLRAGVGQPFGPPMSLGTPFGKVNSGRPWISPDGQRMYFHTRELPGGHAELDLWMTSRVLKKKPEATVPPKAAWRPLFNGKDLSGWDLREPKDWVVKDKEIHGTGIAYLDSKGTFGDFHLRCEVRVSAKGYADLMVRETLKNAIRVPISASHSPMTGALLFENKKTIVTLTKTNLSPKPDKWYTVEVIVRGSHVVLKVDGETTADVKVDGVGASGRIGIRLNNPATFIRFRAIEIRELPPQAAG